jgi:cyclic pyranopterin phosphate synthase
MKDSFGRTIDYLRISVTDRCNLRCVYCMPQNARPLPRKELLSWEEMLRLAGIMAPLGIRYIKVSGGEPLLRKGTADFIGGLKRTPGIEKVTITSNGILLDRCLGDLLKAGIDGINLSLDALDPPVRVRIGGEDSGLFREIPAFLETAGELPAPVKINCVPLRGYNEKEIVPIASLARRGPAVRFIELMPLGRAGAFEGIPEREVRVLLEDAFGTLEPFPGRLGNGPARYYSLRGFAGKIGFISPMSHCFCAQCGRLRLGSTGILRSCLSREDGLDLRGLIRAGASDGDLAWAIGALAAEKPRNRSFPEYAVEMFRIGG